MKKFEVIMNDEDMFIKIISNKKELVVNVNDTFDEICEDNALYVHIGIFKTIFDYCINCNLSIKDSVTFVLNSNMCLSKKIPVYKEVFTSLNQIKIKNWELPTENELNDIADKIAISPSKKQTIYECENNLDVITACIYHFCKRGHRLETCKHCKKWFISESRNDQTYCKRQSPIYPNMDCNRAQKYMRSRVFADDQKKKLKTIENQFRNDGYTIKDYPLKKLKELKEKWANDILDGKATIQEFDTFLKTAYKDIKGDTR